MCISWKKELCEIGEEAKWESRFTSFLHSLQASKSMHKGKSNIASLSFSIPHKATSMGKYDDQIQLPYIRSFVIWKEFREKLNYNIVNIYFCFIWFDYLVDNRRQFILFLRNWNWKFQVFFFRKRENYDATGHIAHLEVFSLKLYLASRSYRIRRLFRNSGREIRLWREGPCISY